MDLRQLAYVVAVVDEGGFTRAAHAMHVAQPSLSQAVRSLEAELGVELFHRGPRAVTLTAAGEALLGPARQALRDADSARAAVAAVAGLDAGRLDLTCLPTLAVHPLADLVGRFRQAHPRVTLRIVEPPDADAAIARVRDGSSEIALAELPVQGADLATHDLERQELVALFPVALDPELTRAGRISIETLASQPLIASPPGTSMRRQLDDAFAAAGQRAQVAIETDHREAIGPLVVAGAGVALLPRRLAEASVAGAGPGAPVGIAAVSPGISRRIGLIHRATPLSPAAAAFVAVAHARPAPTRRRPPPRRRSRARG